MVYKRSIFVYDNNTVAVDLHRVNSLMKTIIDCLEENVKALAYGIYTDKWKPAM